MPKETHFLARTSFGATPASLAALRQMGLAAYLDEQLAPREADDAAALAAIKALRLAIEYEEGKRKMKEVRPLGLLNADLPTLWRLTAEGTPYGEKYRAAEEVVAATWLRALHSRWQLREVMMQFWHNHFNVNIYADERVAITLPLYDRTLRQHAFGNFRAMLQAVAQSPAMLYYLNNNQSKASPANENYARELFELHTLGAMHYYNHLYNRWREVPGAPEGQPIGYIDEDVYEAARAFTGWTVADGSGNDKGGQLPNTGEFYYFEGWHDHYQKRVLATEFAPNQPPLQDGFTVLDMLAKHPGTAKYVCTKLCRYLVADEPPASLVERAAKTWLEHWQSPDQVARVLRVILLSDEFFAAEGQKLKRPFELLASLLRATQPEFTPNPILIWWFGRTGQRLFTWPTPDGHPDTSPAWLAPGLWLARWNLVAGLLLADWHQIARFDLAKPLPAGAVTARQMATFWAERLLGNPQAPVVEKAAYLLASGGSPDEPPLGNADERKYLLNNAVALLAMAPEFQWR
ncbi:MAG: DUF1800 domain-containing protein [Bernardetiaceae bacterium]|jgi:uncharacterized protein (DUF1800 family)|nr:DUF1800 domain-containing protein [Bernardetiaceae bacterium]